MDAVTLKTDFGQVRLPGGMNPMALVYGVGTPYGVKWSEVSDQQRILWEGIRNTQLGAERIEKALQKMGVEYSYSIIPKKNGSPLGKGAGLLRWSLCGLLMHGS